MSTFDTPVCTNFVVVVVVHSLVNTNFVIPLSFIIILFSRVDLNSFAQSYDAHLHVPQENGKRDMLK